MMGNAILPCLHHHSSSKSVSEGNLFGRNHKDINRKTAPAQPAVPSWSVPTRWSCTQTRSSSAAPSRCSPSTTSSSPVKPTLSFLSTSYPGHTLSSSTDASLCANPGKLCLVSFGDINGPFEHEKGEDGKIFIKVVPEFITRLIVTKNNEDSTACGDANAAASHGFLCGTPELQRHYDQLVGSKVQVWSPKLATISEYKARVLPCKLMRLAWKKKERE